MTDFLDRLFNPKVPPSVKVLGLVLIAALIWIGDSVLDSLLFYNIPFSDALWRHVPPHDAFQRILIGVFPFLLGYTVWFRRQSKTVEAERDIERVRFKLAFDTSPDSININRASDGLFVDTNQGFSDLTGWAKEEVMGKTSTEINIWADTEARATLVAGLREKGVVKNLETQFRRRDGSLKTCLMSARIIQIAGEPHILSMTRDISVRKEAEETIRMTEERERLRANDLATILDAIPAAVWIAHDPAGAHITGNRLALEILGISQADNVSKSALDAGSTGLPRVKKDGKELLSEEMPVQRAAGGEEIRDFEFDFEFEDGRITHMLGNATPLRDLEERPRGAVAAFVDITARKRSSAERDSMEQQLIQSQKVEAIGRLAGGIAHDINNMLSVIIGNAEIALAKRDLPAEACTNLEEIQEAAERSASITRQLLAFARRQVISPKLLDLNASVDQILKMLRRLIGEDLELVWRPHNVGGMVKMDPSQLDQLLANLATNARDAIEGVGQLTIETSSALIDETFCANNPGSSPGKYALICVRDSGPGIPEDLLVNIFEPFFTTKAEGKGTGLGLSTVFGIIKQNAGYVSVESELGKGTSFRVYLPIAADEPEVDDDAKVESSSLSGMGTLLLVEDEAALLKLGSTQLRRLGYEVLEAISPEVALEASRRHPGNIELLVTDVVMPGMNGRELSQVLSSERPTMKTLFLSGYTSDIIAERGILQEGVNLLQKPFSRDDLGKKIKGLLSGSTSC